MVKVYCDMCKREIDYNIDGVVKFRHNEKTEERHLCVLCATRVYNWVDEQCKERPPYSEGRVSG